MAPRTEQQFEKIRNEKIDLIKHTALKLFAENGYESASIAQIAKEAGISKGLMYNYFSSKEELLKEILIGGLLNFTKLLQIDNIDKIKKSEIEFFITENIKLLKQKPEFYKLYFSLAFQSKVFKALEQEIMEIFGEIVNVLVNYYTQKGEKQAYVKARFVFAVFDGIGIHYISDLDNFPIDEVENMILDML